MKIKSIATLLGLITLGFGTLPQLGAQTFTVLHDFTNTPDGANPGGLVLSGSTLIGATTSGGSSGNGFIFICGTDGTGLSIVHNFTNTPDGAMPNELLLNNNILFGTTYSGGTNGLGTVFKVGTNGLGYTLLHTFISLSDGARPLAGLTTDGSLLYGATSLGGTTGDGTLYRMDMNGGGFTILHTFTNTPDGADPYATLILSGTNLYGTTFNGGLYGQGTVFKINTNGLGFSVIYNFSNYPDAAFPNGKLVLLNNTLYGTASAGSSSNYGAIFQLNTNGTSYSVLHNFTGPSTPATNSDGGVPKSGLILSGTTLYGDTSSGGSGNGGTVFQIDISGGGFKVLKNFTNSTDGAFPQASLVLNTNGLFGTGYFGGSAGDGTIFGLLFSPTITLQPQSINVQNGNPAIFTVNVADESAINYQWYFNTNTLLVSQTNNTLSFASATNNNAGTYTVTAADSFGITTSSPAILTITAGVPPPNIMTQPQDMIVTNGFAANFSIAVAGQAPLFYQWYFNTNGLLADQTNNTLTFTTDANSGGYYSVIVTNTGGAVTSSAAMLTILPAGPITTPIITAQPQSLSVTNGYPATFSVTATNGALTYQWYLNTNNLLADETNSSLIVPSVTTNDAGAYTVAIANSAGAVTSSPAILTVITNTKPIITDQPDNLIVTNGDTAIFSVTAVGLTPLRYQWYSNSVATAIGTLLAGKTNSTYSFTSITNSNRRFYSVVITNTLGNATSSPAMLTVISQPVITTNPQSLTVNVGDPATFSVAALGRNLHYQWYSNSVATAIGTLLATQTNSTYSFTSITNSNGRFYSVVITNTDGRATSSPALLTVSSLPYITLLPQDATITNGDAVSFTSAAAGPGVLAYQWLFQTNVLIAGATNTTLAFINANQPGTYAMKVTNSFGSVTSSVAQLTVVGMPIMLSANFDAPSGSYSFSYVNLAGSTNRLLTSTNLVPPIFWRAIATNVMATNGLWFFTDPNTAQSNSALFYRFSTP